MKSALITGASSGIGYALAKKLAPDFHLILTGQNEQRLRDLATEINRPCTIICADLSTDRRKIIAEIQKLNPELIIQSAGFGLYGECVALPVDEQLKMIDLNISATVELSIETAKQWIANNSRGIIVNVSSAAAYFEYPSFNIYASTKQFIKQFSKTLDYELMQYGIRVLTACPGMVDTHFRHTASGGYPQEKAFSMSADQAADFIIKQIDKKKRSYLFDWRFRYLIYLQKLFIPNRLIYPYLKKAIDKRHNRSKS